MNNHHHSVAVLVVTCIWIIIWANVSLEVVTCRYSSMQSINTVMASVIYSARCFTGNAPSWAGKALKTSLDLVHDASHNVPFKHSIKKHVPKALKEVVEDVKFQSGSGALKSKHCRVDSHHRQCSGGGGGSGPRRRPRRQHFNDIFA